MWDKPKLLVLLGAGSSIPCGMPSVGKINERMKRWSSERESKRSEPDVFNILWEASARYYEKAENHYDLRPNYERVLGDMTALANWVSPPPFGNPTIDAIAGCSLFSAFASLLDPSHEFAGRHLALDQQAFLLGKLAKHMRDLSKGVDNQSTGLPAYIEFLGKLRERFEVGVYNLNYDTVAITAWPEACRGFDKHGYFHPLAVRQRQEWGFIYHLHGSVHHCINDPAQEIVWKDNLEEPEEFVDRGEPQIDMAQDFKAIPLTTLLAGGFKLEQLLAEPYQTFHATLGRHVYEADAILIIGYGFGDPHVNRAIQNRFDLLDREDRRYPKVVILEKSCPGRPRTGRLEINKFWSWQMKETLNTSFQDILPSKDERTVECLIQKKRFEVSRDGRVAIWHGGVCKAFSAVECVIERLN